MRIMGVRILVTSNARGVMAREITVAMFQGGNRH